MKNTKNVSLWVLGGVGLVVIASFFYLSDGKKAEAGTPIFQVDTEEMELGEITVQGDYPAEFTVTNTGDAPLEISSVRTSCMCTFAEVMIGDKKSPNFNMDMYMSNIQTYGEYMAAKKWKGVLNPGESAIVRVIYKPYLMPVQGSVTRNVKFATSDSNNSVVELGIHAIVK